MKKFTLNYEGENIGGDGVKCRLCKREITEGSTFCNWCGKKQTSEPRKYRKRPNGAGTVYKLTGRRSRPWAAAKCGIIIGYYETRADGLEALEKLAGKDITEYFNMTFDEVYESWKAEHFREISPKGVEGYEEAYDHFEAIHDVKFRSLKTVDYQKEVDKRIEAGKSRSSTEKDRQLIGQMCKWAMREEIITVNYAQFIKLQDEHRKEKEIFTKSEIALFEKAAESDDTAKLICMLLSTGMRIGELFALPVADVHDKYVVGGEKTEAGKNRTIPIREEGRKYFQYFLSRAGDGLLIDGYSGNKKPENFRKREYYDLLEHLNIAKKTPHATRHTYATRAVDEGVSPEVLQKVLGHSKYEVTVECYYHTNAEKLVKAVDDSSKKAKRKPRQKAKSAHKGSSTEVLIS